MTLFLKHGQRILKTYAVVSYSPMKMGKMTIMAATVPCDRGLGEEGTLEGKRICQRREKSSIENHLSAVATLKHLPATFYPHGLAFLSKGTWTAVLLPLLGKASVADTRWVPWKSLNLPPSSPAGCFWWSSMMLWGV